jgi:hypothetical protein
LAIDGSTLNLPNTNEFIEHFGIAKNQSECGALGRISILYDVLNKITLDIQIVPYNSSEKEMALAHLKWLSDFQQRINKKTILLFDRGYPCLGMFLLLKKLAMFAISSVASLIDKKVLK